MSAAVERFYGPLCFVMRRGSRGDYVRYSDYATQSAEIASLREQVAELTRERETKSQTFCSMLSTGVCNLEAENKRLIAALDEAAKVIGPFARAVQEADDRASEMGFAASFDEYKTDWPFTFGHLRAARSWLTRHGEGKADA